jgi:succinyl-diaminopimelate desuccinylase
VAGTDYKLEQKNSKAPLYVSADHFMIKKLSQVYEKETGEKAKLLSIGGGTYARALENIVAFGSLFPGREILAHQVNEFLYIEDLIKMTKIYAPAIQALVEDEVEQS